MAKDKPTPDTPANPPASGDNPTANPPVALDDDKAKVKSILEEMVASGEIFGAGGAGSGGGGSEGGEPIDLEAAIGRVLERRDAASKAQEKEKERDETLADLTEKVGKGLAGRVRRWFEPASPWGD